MARNDVAKSNSYLVLNQSFPEAVMISARIYGSSSVSPAVRFSHHLEAPASYRGGAEFGNVLVIQLFTERLIRTVLTNGITEK